MNQTQPYMDMHSSHMSGAQQHAPQTVTSGAMNHYPQYGQPPLMQHGSGHYSPAPASYSQYGYANGVTSPQSAGHPTSSSMVGSHVGNQMVPLPVMTPGAQTPSGSGGGPNQQQEIFDTTGQIAPNGMKPRVTATLWEDEGSLCFQVEAKGVCVARREDNHMINGTKLLNVAGMTRGRRDGILKSEKMRHVVKIGPMHLKGVWIPFERALDFANKEKITDFLYPLFVHNIGGLLYHPTNPHQHRQGVMQAAERRRTEQNMQDMRGSHGSQPPSLHHHHSMHTPVASHMSNSQIAPHPGSRPGLDRAHTFPTPPTSASIMGMSGPGDSFQWNGQGMGSVQSSQPLSIDTGLSNARSMPATPATTPPGSSMQGMQSYSGGQYDNSRPIYSTPGSQQGQYVPQHSVAQQNMARFGQPMQPNSYMKNDMGPPSARAPGSGPEPDHHGESKPGESLIGQHPGNEPVGHGAGEDEAEHEHEVEYGHDNNAAYNANRGPYNYSSGPSVGSLGGEHPHMSPDMSGSPNNRNNSGRGTPRVGGASSQPQWSSNYQTPPRPHAPSSNLYNVMSNDQQQHGGAGSNHNNGGGGPGGEGAYSSQPALGGAMQTGYPSQQQPIVNGTGSSSSANPAAAPPPNNGNKRSRDYDDEDDGGKNDWPSNNRGSRPTSRGPVGGPREIAGVDGLKRRKTLPQESLPALGGAILGGPTTYDHDAASMNRAQAPIMQRRR